MSVTPTSLAVRRTKPDYAKVPYLLVKVLCRVLVTTARAFPVNQLADTAAACISVDMLAFALTVLRFHYALYPGPLPIVHVAPHNSHFQCVVCHHCPCLSVPVSMWSMTGAAWSPFLQISPDI